MASDFHLHNAVTLDQPVHFGRLRRGYCAGEDVCEVNVFEGTELATHEYPVPDANRAALKWVLLYRHDETPRIVIEEAHAAPGQEKRRWTFDR